MASAVLVVSSSSPSDNRLRLLLLIQNIIKNSLLLSVGSFFMLIVCSVAGNGSLEFHISYGSQYRSEMITIPL